MDTTYDGLLLGSGHNTLVLAAYLARAGLRCLVLERAAEFGGGLATDSHPGLEGFRHNVHSFFHRALTSKPWFRDLELEHYGVRYVEPELNVAMILRDGRTLEWWTDNEKTAASFAEFSRRDARKLRQWIDEFAPIVDELVVPESEAPPLPPEVRQARLSSTPAGRRLLEVSAWSPLEFVMREFENDVVRAGLLFFNGLREVDLRLKGFGHSIPSLLASPHKAQMCVGGSHALAQGLVAAIEAHGSAIRCDVTIERILLQGERAVGVELAGGETIGANAFVASGLNPQQTFVDLLPTSEISRRLQEKARGFRYNVLAPLFGLYLALNERPRYRAVERRPEIDDAFMTILGLESLEQFDAIVRAHEGRRRPPMRVAWGATPTRFDGGQAPPGKHTAFLWEKVPFDLSGESTTWSEVAGAHASELLEMWSSYAPNLAEPGVVRGSFHATPAATYERLPNMQAGDLLVGSFADGQIGFHRPFEGAGSYRTPIRALYLCGGSTHPGGNITGLGGYNAARVVAHDLGVDVERLPWWGGSNDGAAHGQRG